jgi:hypothetical protein
MTCAPDELDQVCVRLTMEALCQGWAAAEASKRRSSEGRGDLAGGCWAGSDHFAPVKCANRIAPDDTDWRTLVLALLRCDKTIRGSALAKTTGPDKLLLGIRSLPPCESPTSLPNFRSRRH